MQVDVEFEIHNLEQIAYGAVLRAFKAQSNTLTWEKEGLITELRKELRVSNEEHRELLTEVIKDNLVRRITEWRKSGGIAVPSPQSLHGPHSNSMGATRQTLPSSMKWAPTSGIGIGGQRPNAPCFTRAKPVQYHYIDHASGAPVDNPSESIHDYLIGRKVMIRWPGESNFYEAVITDYNPVDGRHSLVYDHNTPNETVEWVNMKEVPHEDIRWVGYNPVLSRVGEPGLLHPGRGRTTLMNQFNDEFPASRNGVVKEDLGEVVIYHTDTLIKKVEEVLGASHPDISEIDKAKKLLKEHEQTLVQLIAKLADACGIGSEDND